MELYDGIVIKSTGSWFIVEKSNETKYYCRLKGKLRTKNSKNTSMITVGDHVRFEIQNELHESGYKQGIITDLKERKNYIIRKSINLSKQNHIIASNIDQALLVTTINYPPTSTTFIDRFLVSSEAYKIEVIIVFNKIDLYTPDELLKIENLITIYTNIGYKCIKTSVIENSGCDEIIKQLKDKTSVIAGHSGVGKSSLINKIDSNITLLTNEISEINNSGKHTTTFTEMHKLNFGGYIIDTPGIKGFGLIEIDKSELYHYFPEIFKISHECKFHNCIHINEPNCAVIDAVAKSKIALSRYESYLNIIDGDKEEKYR